MKLYARGEFIRVEVKTYKEEKKYYLVIGDSLGTPEQTMDTLSIGVDAYAVFAGEQYSYGDPVELAVSVSSVNGRLYYKGYLEL